jgi:hypothetical protein
MYLVSDQQIPLCLDCYVKVAHISQQQIENAERQMNYLSDEMDAMFGVGPIGPRFPPRPAPVYVGGTRLNNIHVSNSVIGTLNTGTIGSVDQSISALIQTAQAEVAQALKELTEAVAKSADLTINQKDEVLEALSVIAREAATPATQRKKSVARTLITQAASVTKSAADIAQATVALWPIVAAAFN